MAPLPPKPEAQARERIDRALAAAGWRVQDRDEADLHAARGIAVREFPLASGQRTRSGPKNWAARQKKLTSGSTTDV